MFQFYYREAGKAYRLVMTTSSQSIAEYHMKPSFLPGRWKVTKDGKTIKKFGGSSG